MLDCDDYGICAAERVQKGVMIGTGIVGTRHPRERKLRREHRRAAS